MVSNFLFNSFTNTGIIFYLSNGHPIIKVCSQTCLGADLVLRIYIVPRFDSDATTDSDVKYRLYRYLVLTGVLMPGFSLAMRYRKVSIPEPGIEKRYQKESIPGRGIEIGYRKVLIPKLVFNTSFFSS